MDDYVDDDDDIVNDQPVELLVPLEDSHVLRQDNVLVYVQDALTGQLKLLIGLLVSNNSEHLSLIFVTIIK